MTNGDCPTALATVFARHLGANDTDLAVRSTGEVAEYDVANTNILANTFCFTKFPTDDEHFLSDRHKEMKVVFKDCQGDPEFDKQMKKAIDYCQQNDKVHVAAVAKGIQDKYVIAPLRSVVKDQTPETLLEVEDNTETLPCLAIIGVAENCHFCVDAEFMPIVGPPAMVACMKGDLGHLDDKMLSIEALAGDLLPSYRDGVSWVGGWLAGQFSL